MNYVAFTIDKAAEAVCCSPNTIRRAIASGDLIAHWRAGKQLLLRVDLEDWVEGGPTDGSEGAH